MAVGANDDISAHRVQPMIAVQIALLEGALGVKFDSRIAIRLRRRRDHTQCHRNTRQDRGNAAGRITVVQCATLQGEPPPHPVARIAAPQEFGPNLPYRVKARG